MGIRRRLKWQYVKATRNIFSGKLYMRDTKKRYVLYEELVQYASDNADFGDIDNDHVQGAYRPGYRTTVKVFASLCEPFLSRILIIHRRWVENIYPV